MILYVYIYTLYAFKRSGKIKTKLLTAKKKRSMIYAFIIKDRRVNYTQNKKRNEKIEIKVINKTGSKQTEKIKETKIWLFERSVKLIKL